MTRTPLLALLLLTAACQPAATAPQQSTLDTLPAQPTRYTVRVVATHPHDRAAFTQGLFFLDGVLYESTGLVGRSTIRRVNIADGQVLQSTPIPPRMFGEGITNWGDQIISITWQNGTGFRWDRRTFQQLGQFQYRGEGWGLTQNGREIIMSDGTADLRFLDPTTLQETRRVTVTDRGRPVDRLNELEWVNGEVFANVWTTDQIVRIDPASGRVTGWIDLAPLVAQAGRSPGADVLNGIAYDPATDRLWVTGKNWPQLYEVDLVPAAG